MGGKTTAGPMMPYQASQSTVSIPPEVLARYNAVNARAEQVASQPFQAYSQNPADFVAQLNAQQRAGMAQTGAYSQAAQPGIQAGMNIASQGYGALGAGMGSIGQGMGAYQGGLGATMGVMGQNVSNQNIAGVSSPYYQTAQNFTQAAATGPGGYQAASPYYQGAQGYAQEAASAPGGYQAGSPYLGTGAALAGQAAQASTPVGQEQIQQYMSPYLQAVANPTMAFMRQQQEQQMAGQLGNAIQSGAFGGDRAGLAAATLAAQQQMAGAKTYGDIMQQGYGQALSSAFQAQQAQQADLARRLSAGQTIGGLGATAGQLRQADLARVLQSGNLMQQIGSGAGQLQQADLARMLQAGGQMGQLGTAARGAYETQQQFQQADLARQLQAAAQMGQLGAGMGALGQAQAGIGQGYGQLGTQMGALGTAAQTAGLQGAQAQLGAGTLEQQTQQAGLQALYNQFLQQQAYPYQQAQFLANIAMGTGALSGSTNTGYTSQQSQYQPFFSDRRLKDGVDSDEGGSEPEIIGETFDGQKIYRYRLHNPVTGELEPPQIGLMADEAEKVHPDAVGENRGFKTLDYRRATDEAADIAKGLGAARLGGAVTSSGDYARGGFASGGFDYVSPDSYEATMERILGKQKGALGLGAVGGDIKSGPYGGSGLNLKASYVPEANLPVGKLMEAQPMHVSAPKEAPPSTMSQLGGLASSGLNLYKEATGKSGLHEAYEALTKKSHGGLVPHYDLGGDIPYADKSDGYIPKELTQSKPVEQLKGPALPGSQDQGGKGSGGLGGMIDTAAKGIGAAKTAYDLGSTIVAALPTVAAMFSDTRLKTGVGRDGYADGRAVDPEEDNARREREIEQTLKFEGGLNPSDTNRTPSMYGINQAAHPGIDVKKLSPEQAKDIYRKEYWEGIGAANLPERIQGMAYDTAVMAGPGRARQLIKQAGDDPEKFMAARESFLNSLIERDPEKYGKYAKAWANRNETLRNQAGLGNADAVLAHLPAGAKDFYGKANETSGGVKPDTRDFGDKATDFLTSERFIIPVLTGLGAMASSPSRYLGSAILQGLGAGAQSYMQVPKTQAEIEEIRARAGKESGLEQQARSAAELARAGIPKVGAETQKVEAETKEQLSKLYEKQWVPNVGWMVYDKSNPFATPRRISDPRGNPISGTKITPQDVPTKAGSPQPETETAPVVTETKKPVVGSAAEWTPTLAAPEGTQIPGALNIAMTPGKQEQANIEATKMLEAQRQRANAAFDQQYRIDEMEQQFRNLPEKGILQAGPYAQLRTNFAKGVNEAVTMLGGKPLFDPSQVGAAENLAKDTTRLGFDTAKALGHEPGFIVQQSVSANPGMENTKVAFERITAGLREASKYEQDKLAFLEDYNARFGTITGAEQLFRKLNPPKKYADRAILSTIDAEDMQHIKSSKPEDIAKHRKEIDAKYGQGITDLLLGAK